MSHTHAPAAGGAPVSVAPSDRAVADRALADQAEPSLGSLVSDLSTQLPALIRSELRLAQAEMAQKGKRAGIGIGAFSAAGLLAFFGTATLLTAAILLLDLVMPAWAAALVVTGVLFVLAAVAALFGKKKVDQVGAPKPERTIENLKQDVAAVKGARS